MIRFEKANGYSEVIDPSKVKAVHRMVSCGSRPQSIIVLDQPNDNSVPVLGTVSEVKRKLRVPAAYRLLEVGEVIRKGDEYNWNITDRIWKPANRLDDKVRLGDAYLYRRPVEAAPVKAKDTPVTISRRKAANKIFKLAKRLGKHNVDWTFEPFADDLRTLLKVLRKLEKEALGGAK